MRYIGDSYSIYSLIITNNPVTLDNSIIGNVAKEKLINIQAVDELYIFFFIMTGR